MYVYIYIHTYLHTHTRIFVCIYIYIYIYTHVYRCLFELVQTAILEKDQIRSKSLYIYTNYLEYSVHYVRQTLQTVIGGGV